MKTLGKGPQPTRSAERRSFLSRSPWSIISLTWPAAYWARRVFLSYLPTLVLGTSGMKAPRSGTHHLATRGASCVGSGASERGGAPPPAVFWPSDDRGFENVGVIGDGVLQFDRRNPFTAGFDDIL